MSMRAVPFYCPYCAEQTIEPRSETTYYCASCDRTFVVRFVTTGDAATSD